MINLVKTLVIGVFMVLTISSSLQTVQAQEAQQQEKLKVSVYYETLCGDSKRFIRSQLYPLVIEQAASKNLDVQLVPYGKATTTLTSDGNYIFSCQHREDECEGNKMHSCALKYIKDQDQQVEFITCSMSSSFPPTSLNECASQIRLDSAIKSSIRNCSESTEGDKLLAANGILTDRLSPKLFFVPTVTYNGKFEEDKMWESLGNFRSIVCDQLKTSNIKATFCGRQSREYRGDRRARRSYFL